MEEKRLVRTDKSLRCILYTHHKYYSLTALRLAGDNTKGHSQSTTILMYFVRFDSWTSLGKCCIKYDYPAQSAPGLSARDGGDCLFGFGCSPLSWILVLHYITHITRHTPLTSPTITAASCQHGAGPALRSARIYIHETGKRKELYPAVFLLAWRVTCLDTNLYVFYMPGFETKIAMTISQSPGVVY